jgi:hypothetical protein
MTDSLESALEARLLARSQVSPRDVEALRLFARTLPARRRFWRGPAIQLALSAAAVVVAAVVVLPMLFRAPGFGSVTPAPATPTPVATQPAPTPGTTAPSIGDRTVRLLTGSGSAVEVVIDDPEGWIVGARAEQADATMSVRWFESIVENADTAGYDIRLTWVGFPRDETVRLEVSQATNGKIRLHFIQDGPPPNSDGLGEDRVMVLSLPDEIGPDSVQVTFDYPA